MDYMDRIISFLQDLDVDISDTYQMLLDARDEKSLEGYSESQFNDSSFTLMEFFLLLQGEPSDRENLFKNVQVAKNFIEDQAKKNGIEIGGSIDE